MMSGRFFLLEARKILFFQSVHLAPLVGRDAQIVGTFLAGCGLFGLETFRLEN